MRGLVTNIEALRQKSREATKEEAVELFPELEKICKEEGGCGLAAIQGGIPVRVAVVRLPKTEFSEGLSLDLVNPRIIEKKIPRVFLNEGCLSLPSTFVNTVRFTDIVLENKGKRYVLTGLDAVVVQHEVDHMDGILMIDHEEKDMRTIGRNDKCPFCGIKFKRCPHGK